MLNLIIIVVALALGGCQRHYLAVDPNRAFSAADFFFMPIKIWSTFSSSIMIRQDRYLRLPSMIMESEIYGENLSRFSIWDGVMFLPPALSGGLPKFDFYGNILKPHIQ
jgi:hypothetical protein